MKISEVAVKYNITKRTLRYYEEIGVFESIDDREIITRIVAALKKSITSNINSIIG